MFLRKKTLSVTISFLKSIRGKPSLKHLNKFTTAQQRVTSADESQFTKRDQTTKASRKLYRLGTERQPRSVSQPAEHDLFWKQTQTDNECSQFKVYNAKINKNMRQPFWIISRAGSCDSVLILPSHECLDPFFEYKVESHSNGLARKLNLNEHWALIVRILLHFCITFNYIDYCIILFYVQQNPVAPFTNKGHTYESYNVNGARLSNGFARIARDSYTHTQTQSSEASITTELRLLASVKRPTPQKQKQHSSKTKRALGCDCVRAPDDIDFVGQK